MTISPGHPVAWSSMAALLENLEAIADEREVPDDIGMFTAEAAAPDGRLRVESPGLAAWRGHASGNVVWFEWDGRERRCAAVAHGPRSLR